MASMTETWKNSGKAAWKKRINKIRENSRGRKPPRNRLDDGEIEEILQLERQIEERERWERLEKSKMKVEGRSSESSKTRKRKKPQEGTIKKQKKEPPLEKWTTSCKYTNTRFSTHTIPIYKLTQYRSKLKYQISHISLFKHGGLQSNWSCSEIIPSFFLQSKPEEVELHSIAVDWQTTSALSFLALKYRDRCWQHNLFNQLLAIWLDATRSWLDV